MRLFLFLFSLFFAQTAWGFELSLAESTLDLGKGVSSTTATIVNNSTTMIAIEAGARIRRYSEDGVENFDTAAENLIMIPSQMIIPPNGEQVLNIRWTGPRDISDEKAYRLLIEYVAISEDKLKGVESQEQQAGININYRIAKSFYVSPRGAKAKIELNNIRTEQREGKAVLGLFFENTGTKHQIIHGLDLEVQTVTDEKLKLSFGSEELGGSINFLPKEKRQVFIPTPELLTGKEIKKATILGFGQ